MWLDNDSNLRVEPASSPSRPQVCSEVTISSPERDGLLVKISAMLVVVTLAGMTLACNYAD